MKKEFEYTVDINKSSLVYREKALETYMFLQVKDKSSPNFGGLLYPSGIVATESINSLNVIGLYFCKESKYYHSEKAYDFFMALYSYLERTIRPEGLIDYHVCNFHSGPDTAFSILGLASPYRYSLLDESDEKGILLRQMLLSVIRRFADGVAEAGFHTPNHRWVECAALALAKNILGDEKYQKRIDAFLLEGIDCNEDGEYTERSAGMYNYVCDNALIILAIEQKKPELLQYVRRNLLMMPYYFDEDFRIFTLNSTRQDNGATVYADKYLPLYLACGHLLQDDTLLGIGKAIFDSITENRRPLPSLFHEIALTPELYTIPDVAPFQVKNYNKHFENSGLIRMNNGGFFATIMENADTFLFLNYKDIDFYIRGGIHFFNDRHLRVSHLTKTDNGYEMTYHGEGVYYKPYGYFPGTTDFGSLDREQRDKTETYTVDVRIKVEMEDKGYRITVCGDGVDRVPVRFEIGFLPNITVFSESEISIGKAGARGVLRSGYTGVMSNNLAHGLKIGPTFADHFITSGLFGSRPVDEKRHTLFFGALTPFEKSFTVEPVESINDLHLKGIVE